MPDRKQFRVALLMGGDSPEREISLASGISIASALECAGHDVHGIDPAEVDRIVSEFNDTFHRPLYQMGHITDTDQLELVETDGHMRTLVPTGWNHFKKEP